MAEYWDLYDEKRHPLGRQIMRGQLEAQKGEFHVVVMIMTMNSHGQLLCTLRSPDKATYPNLWEITAGSVLAGEDSLSGARRELFEETGIAADDDEMCFVTTVKENTAFIDCYFVRRDVEINALKLQEGETVRAKWVGKDEFENMIAQKKIAFPVTRRYLQLHDFLMQEGFI